MQLKYINYFVFFFLGYFNCHVLMFYFTKEIKKW